MSLKNITIVASIILMTGCSSLNNKTLLAGATSFVVCSLVGANSAPEDENENMHGAMYGGLCSTAAMAISELIKDSPNRKEINRLNTKYRKLETDEVAIRKSLLESDSIKSMDQSIQDSIKGKWDAYSKSEWIIDEGGMRHENLEIRFKNKGKVKNEK